MHSAAPSAALHPAVRNLSSPTYSRDSKYSCLLPGSRLSTPSLAFHFAPSDPNPPTPPPDPLSPSWPERPHPLSPSSASLPFHHLFPPAFSPALPRLLQLCLQLPGWSRVGIIRERACPPGPRLTLGGASLPARASPATSAAPVFMSSWVPRPLAAYSRPSPGRAGRLGVTASLDSQGPGSHRSCRSWAPHTHPPTPPRAWRGKGDPGRLGASRPPPPRRPPGERPAGKPALLLQAPTFQLGGPQGTDTGPYPGPLPSRGTQMCRYRGIPNLSSLAASSSQFLPASFLSMLSPLTPQKPRTT